VKNTKNIQRAVKSEVIEMSKQTTAKENTTPLSVVAAFDDLVRNSSVLAPGSEEKFLQFVVNTGVSRQRWEHAELECQRLRIELTKCSQDISVLEHKLQHARKMLDTEVYLRKKAEEERDRLASQLMVLRQLMDSDQGSRDEVTLQRIRGLDECGVKSNNKILSEMTRSCRRRSLNMTEGSTLLDVEDLSLDDAQELCESRTGTTYQGTGGREKNRNRSGTRVSEVVLVGGKENMNIRQKEPHICEEDGHPAKEVLLKDPICEDLPQMSALQGIPPHGVQGQGEHLRPQPLTPSKRKQKTTIFASPICEDLPQVSALQDVPPHGVQGQGGHLRYHIHHQSLQPPDPLTPSKRKQKTAIFASPMLR